MSRSPSEQILLLVEARELARRRDTRVAVVPRAATRVSSSRTHGLLPRPAD